MHEEKVDYLADLTLDQKRARLRKISCRDFLRDYAKVDDQLIRYFQQRSQEPCDRRVAVGEMKDVRIAVAAAGASGSTLFPPRAADVLRKPRS